MRKMIFGLTAGLAMLAASAVYAVPMFVGSYQVDSGVNWTNNPPVFSAVEAAAIIFGGAPGDYRVSINADMVDPATITDTGWYSRIGIAGGYVFADDFSRDLGGPGYGAAGWVDDDDISAWVDDNAIGPEFTNYVWRDLNGLTVPEPATAALLGLGLVGMGAVRRRRARC